MLWHVKAWEPYDGAGKARRRAPTCLARRPVRPTAGSPRQARRRVLALELEKTDCRRRLNAIRGFT